MYDGCCVAHHIPPVALRQHNPVQLHTCGAELARALGRNHPITCITFLQCIIVHAPHALMSKKHTSGHAVFVVKYVTIASFDPRQL